MLTAETIMIKIEKEDEEEREGKEREERDFDEIVKCEIHEPLSSHSLHYRQRVLRFSSVLRLIMFISSERLTIPILKISNN